MSLLLGKKLMPWQLEVFRVALEIDEEGNLVRDRVILTVPRQNGKTWMVMVLMVWWATMWPEPQRIIYSSQDGQSANERLILEMAPIIERSKIRSMWLSTFKGIGLQRIDFKGNPPTQPGSSIGIVSKTESSGQGKTLDLVICDEAWKDTDNRRELSLLSTMITKRNAQIWVVSTAGTEASVYLARQRDMGRASVAAGDSEGICYFEWSAPQEADYRDPAVWRAAMPSLGYTITEKKLAAILDQAPAADFQRMQLNQWVQSEDAVIPASLWNAVQRDDLKLDREVVVFGLDVTPDRLKASITVADTFKRCELLESDLTPSEAADRVLELGAKYSASCVIDATGPAARFKTQLQQGGVKVHDYATQDMAKACARFYDAIADGKIEISRDDALDRAVVGAIKRITVDTWTWSRKGEVDISPLVALTMCFDKASMSDSVWVFKA